MGIQSKGFQLTQLHTLVLCRSCNLKAASVYLADDQRIAIQAALHKVKVLCPTTNSRRRPGFPDTAALSEKDQILLEVEAKSLITYQASKEFVQPVEHFWQVLELVPLCSLGEDTVPL